MSRKILSNIKCKQCRNIIVTQGSDVIVTSHGNNIENNGCGNDPVWYVDDDKAPKWILDKVTDGDWQKGRLNCPNCDARIGSFDFTSGMRCPCQKCVLPGIKLIKSKVDT